MNCKKHFFKPLQWKWIPSGGLQWSQNLTVNFRDSSIWHILRYDREEFHLHLHVIIHWLNVLCAHHTEEANFMILLNHKITALPQLWNTEECWLLELPWLYGTGGFKYRYAVHQHNQLQYHVGYNSVFLRTTLPELYHPASGKSPLPP